MTEPVGQSVCRRQVGQMANRWFVAACADDDSLWVEIRRAPGSKPWNLSPRLARELAAMLTSAAATVEKDASNHVEKSEA
jgi:hypothetical protein